jgi:hypothetical protein
MTLQSVPCVLTSELLDLVEFCWYGTPFGPMTCNGNALWEQVQPVYCTKFSHQNTGSNSQSWCMKSQGFQNWWSQDPVDVCWPKAVIVTLSKNRYTDICIRHIYICLYCDSRSKCSGLIIVLTYSYHPWEGCCHVYSKIWHDMTMTMTHDKHWSFNLAWPARVFVANGDSARTCGKMEFRHWLTLFIFIYLYLPWLAVITHEISEQSLLRLTLLAVCNCFQYFVSA